MSYPSPDTFIVRIIGRDGQPVGVGTMVTKQHIVTCAHVVNAALGFDIREQSRPTGMVRLDFPLLQLTPPERVPAVYATVKLWRPPPLEGIAGDDIAGLALVNGSAPEKTSAARLAVGFPRPGRTVRVFGYPIGRPNGGWVVAVILGPVGDGRLQIDSASALRVQQGFSGSPVFDDCTRRVIGLIAAAPTGVSELDSYAIGAEQLRLAWPEVLAKRWQPNKLRLALHRRALLCKPEAR